MTNEVKTRVSKGKLALDRAERNLKDVGELFERAAGQGGLNTPAELARIETTLGKIETFLKDADEQISLVPAVGEFSSLHERLKAGNKQFADYRQRIADDQKKSRDQNDALEGGIEKDRAAMKALTELADDLKKLAPRDEPAKIATVLPFEKDAQRFVDTYAPLKNATSKDAVDMKRTAAFLTAILKDVRREHEGMVKQELPTEIDGLLKKLEEQGRDAVQSKKFVAFNTGLDEFWLKRGVENLRLLAPGVPGADLTFADRAEARVREIRAEVNKAAEKVIASNRARPSTYAGPDTDGLTSYLKGIWKNNNPGETVIGTRFHDVWTRRTSWDWSDFDRSWQKSDASSILCAVLVKSPDGKFAFQHYVRVYKNHLKGDQLSTRIDVPPAGTRPANPFDIIPIGNL